MPITFNSADLRLAGRDDRHDARMDQQRARKGGLLISPENAGRPEAHHQIDAILLIIASGLVISTLVFIAALIAIALA